MFLRKAILPIAILCLCASLFAFREKEKTSTLSFTILKGYNGRPIKNAAVILHSVNKKGQQANGGLELKTDNDGRASIDSIPYGRVRIQVIVPGFTTYGDDIDVSQPEQSLTIKMDEPKGQYSIYTGGVTSTSPSPSPSPSGSPAK
jgi:hypothetical protein